MSTVFEVADRTFREWLLPGDDQPVRVTFAAAVDASASTWTYNADTLAPDEETLLSPGIIVEAADGEQALITDVDYTGDSLTVRRGYNGTVASAHGLGDTITVAPVYSRRAVLDAVKDNVPALYPSLWQVGTAELTTANTPVEVPAEVVSPVSFMWKNGIRWQQGIADLIEHFPPSSTGKAVQFYGVPSGRTGLFTYRGRFTRPSTDGTDLSTLGVNSEWERIVAVGAAAQVVGGRSVEALTSEYVTGQLERETVPVGSSGNVIQSLLQLYSVWLDQANRNLRAEQQSPVVHHLAVRG